MAWFSQILANGIHQDIFASKATGITNPASSKRPLIRPKNAAYWTRFGDYILVAVIFNFGSKLKSHMTTKVTYFIFERQAKPSGQIASPCSLVDHD